MAWDFLEPLLQDFELLFLVALGESAEKALGFLLFCQLEVTVRQSILCLLVGGVQRHDAPPQGHGIAQVIFLVDQPPGRPSA